MSRFIKLTLTDTHNQTPGPSTNNVSHILRFSIVQGLTWVEVAGEDRDIHVAESPEEILALINLSARYDGV